MTASLEERVLIVAPAGRDGALLRDAGRDAGLDVVLAFDFTAMGLKGSYPAI